jgi:hypothetical protein
MDPKIGYILWAARHGFYFSKIHKGFVRLSFEDKERTLIRVELAPIALFEPKTRDARWSSGKRTNNKREWACWQIDLKEQGLQLDDLLPCLKGKIIGPQEEFIANGGGEIVQRIR